MTTPTSPAPTPPPAAEPTPRPRWTGPDRRRATPVQLGTFAGTMGSGALLVFVLQSVGDVQSSVSRQADQLGALTSQIEDLRRTVTEVRLSTDRDIADLRVRCGENARAIETLQRQTDRLAERLDRQSSAEQFRGTRLAGIVQAIAGLAPAAQSPGDWTGDGRPRTAALSSRTGHPVSEAERDEAFALWRLAAPAPAPTAPEQPPPAGQYERASPPARPP